MPREPTPSSPTARSAASSTEGRIRIDPWDPALVQPASRRPAARRLVPRLPQPPRRRRSTCATRRPTSPRRSWSAGDEPFVIHPGEFCARPHAGVGRAARRHRRADRGQVEPGPPRPDRPRHRGLRRPGLEGHADARAQQPDARPDQALRRAADRAAVVHGARPPGRAPYGSPELGSHYQGQVAATESRYGRAAGRCPPPMLASARSCSPQEAAEEEQRPDALLHRRRRCRPSGPSCVRRAACARRRFPASDAAQRGVMALGARSSWPRWPWPRPCSRRRSALDRGTRAGMMRGTSTTERS